MSFFKKNFLQIAFALFAMFFGAGNLIFPLALGKEALNLTLYALIGFCITAVIIPFLGVFVMVSFQGNIQRFFSLFGKKGGLCLATITISLLGPLGAAPRCLTIAYAASFKDARMVFLILFACLSCGCIYLLAEKEKGILKTLGTWMAPIKLSLLLLIIGKGFWDRPDELLTQSEGIWLTQVFEGSKSGYFTMDLMAGLFFAPLVLNQLRGKESNPIMKKGSIVAGLILAGVYAGFSFLSYFHAASLQGVRPDQILAALCYKILGQYGALFLSLMMSVACFSTALSLIAAFVDFIYREIFQKKIAKKWLLSASCLFTAIMTCFSFDGINQLMGPFLAYFYPVLILLTFYNFFRKKQLAHGEIQ